MPRSIFRDLFSIDIRSLAFFRTGLALVLWWDLEDRAKSLTVHYTDAGILPHAALTKYFTNTILSFYTVGGDVVFETTLFLIAACPVALLLIGWHTRWAAVLLFVLLFSLQQRNILILEAGDRLLRFLLMRSIFYPLGQLPQSMRGGVRRRPSIRVFPMASMALLLQPIMFYVVLTISKLQAVPWVEGWALYSALNTAIFVRPSRWANFAWFSAPYRSIEYTTVGVEGLIPVMLVLP